MAFGPQLIPDGLERRRRRKRHEAAVDTGTAPDPKQCPACGTVVDHRTRRQLFDRLMFRENVYLCPQCDRRFWSHNYQRITKAALVVTATISILILGYLIKEFAPSPGRRVVVNQADFGSVGPRSGARLHLTPDQNRALLRQMQGRQMQGKDKLPDSGEATVNPASPPLPVR